MPREDLDWAISTWRAKSRVDRYKLYRDYYEGDHRLLFATERFNTIFGRRFHEVKDNLCPAVVDSLADRLKITGFRSTNTNRGRDIVGGAAWSVWERNRMGQRGSEVHRDALAAGDGYAMVWPDENEQAAIWPYKPEEIVIEYSELVPGTIARAARVWRDGDGRYRVNLFYPDHTERYVTTTKRSGGRLASGRSFATFGVTEGFVDNPYGRVPIFHFPNKRLFAYGVSELKDVVLLQDALNKAVCDMIVAMEFASFRQRWATGIEVEVDEATEEPKPPRWRPGIDRVWAAENDQAAFGEFTETNLGQFLEVQEDLRSEIARVSGTPLHYLFITRGDFPSGEAMKSAEARFSMKLADRQESFGNTWEDLLRFALTVDRMKIPAGTEISSSWASATPRSEEEQTRTLLNKKALGVSRRQRLRELGYSDDDIEKMIAEEPTEPPETAPAT